MMSLRATIICCAAAIALLVIVLAAGPAMSMSEVPEVEQPRATGTISEEITNAYGDACAGNDLREYTFRCMVYYCFACATIETVYIASETFARVVFQAVADGLYPFAIAAFSAWVFWQGARMFFPSIGGDAREIVRTVAMRSLVFVIVLTVLGPAGRSTFFSWIYDPILRESTSGAALIVSEVLNAGAETGTSARRIVYEDRVLGELDAPPGFAGSAMLDTATGGYLSRIIEYRDSLSPGAQPIGETLHAMNQAINPVQRVAGFGVVMALATFHQSRSLGFIDPRNLLDLFFGALLGVVYGTVLLVFILHLISLFARMAILGALFPIVAVMSLFQVTRGAVSEYLRSVGGVAITLFSVGISFSIGALLVSLSAPQLAEIVALPMDATLDEMASAFAVSGRGLQVWDSSYWWLLFIGLVIPMINTSVAAISTEVLGLKGAATLQGLGRAVGFGALTAIGIVGSAALLGTGMLIGAAASGTGLGSAGGMLTRGAAGMGSAVTKRMGEFTRGQSDSGI